jgi:trans-AT polyketide synthase/acyltransferase/oxidoreductase domain-containing protein
MFSGQGSQYRGMGRALLESEPAFRARVEKLCAVAGSGMRERLFEKDPRISESWDDLTETHPLLYILQTAFGLWWRERGFPVDGVLGYSLGELVAAAVSGLIDPEDGVRIAVGQADHIVKACTPAVMVAVLSDAQTLTSVGGFRGKIPAAVHFKNNTVWVFQEPAWPPVEFALKEKRISHQVLPVCWPFHTPQMESARERILRDLAVLDLSRPTLPFYSVGRNAWYSPGIGAAHFQEILEDAIDFPATVRNLEGEGPWNYVDGGPSGTLANFVRYNLPPLSPSRTKACFTPFSHGVVAREKMSPGLPRGE